MWPIYAGRLLLDTIECVHDGLTHSPKVSVGVTGRKRMRVTCPQINENDVKVIRMTKMNDEGDVWTTTTTHVQSM